MNTIAAFTAIGLRLSGPLNGLLYRYVNAHLARAALDVRGIEHLRAAGGAAFILAANHVAVPGRGVATCGPSPDTFLFERLLRQTTGQALRLTPLNNIDDNADLAWLRWQFARDAIDGVRQGIVRGMGHIPFEHDNPASVRGILRAVEAQLIPRRECLLIYPQGHWAPDLLPSDEFQGGAAYLAIQFALPILPAYIRGCDTWDLPRPVTVAFAAPLLPPPRIRKTFSADVKALTALTKSTLLALRDAAPREIPVPVHVTSRPRPHLSH